MLLTKVLIAQNAPEAAFIQIEQDKRIKVLIDKKRIYNRTLKKSKVFRIQIYNGSKSEAYKAKKHFETFFSSKTYVTFESPEWKIRVGDYRTVLDADRALQHIKKEFPAAFVVPIVIVPHSDKNKTVRHQNKSLRESYGQE